MASVAATRAGAWTRQHPRRALSHGEGIAAIRHIGRASPIVEDLSGQGSVATPVMAVRPADLRRGTRRAGPAGVGDRAMAGRGHISAARYGAKVAEVQRAVIGLQHTSHPMRGRIRAWPTAPTRQTYVARSRAFWNDRILRASLLPTSIRVEALLARCSTVWTLQACSPTIRRISSRPTTLSPRRCSTSASVQLPCGSCSHLPTSTRRSAPFRTRRPFGMRTKPFSPRPQPFGFGFDS